MNNRILIHRRSAFLEQYENSAYEVFRQIWCQYYTLLGIVDAMNVLLGIFLHTALNGYSNNRWSNCGILKFVFERTPKKMVASQSFVVLIVLVITRNEYCLFVNPLTHTISTMSIVIPQHCWVVFRRPTSNSHPTQAPYVTVA